MYKLLISIVLLTVGGCAAKTSPERHSLYYARHDPTMEGGNYVKRPGETAKLNLAVYQAVYSQGVNAKAKGVTPAQAASMAGDIYHSGVKATGGTETFMGLKDHKTQVTADERASQLWGQTLKETFLDGYNGIQ